MIIDYFQTLLRSFLPAIFFVLAPLLAQAVVKGKVLDELGQPVAAASVYINNTTYGVLTDVDGNFELLQFPPPPFRLTVSCIGYESNTVIVKAEYQGKVIVDLKLKVSSIDEVLVRNPLKNGWAKFGNDFRREFIGYSEFADQTEILNKEVLKFVYDAEEMKLSVYADKPLKIRNKATGYIITFWLDEYKKDYPANKVVFSGNAHFSSMKSTKARQQQRWVANRLSSYRGSITHFMRSVFTNRVYEEGFELRVYQRTTAEEFAKSVPIRTDTVHYIRDTAIKFAITGFLNYTPEYVNKLKFPISEWLNNNPYKQYTFVLHENSIDTTKEPRLSVSFTFNPFNQSEKWIQYFDQKRRLVDTFYERELNDFQTKASTTNKKVAAKKNPVYYGYLSNILSPIDSFIVQKQDGALMLKFEDYIQVTYKFETLEQAYIDSQRLPKPSLSDLQTSLLHQENDDGVQVLADGSYHHAYDLLVKDYWSYEKLDKMLPYDYVPPE